MNNTLITIGLVIVFSIVALAFWIGRERGRDDVHKEIEEASREAKAARERIEDDVKARPDDQLDRDLDQWMRD